MKKRTKATIKSRRRINATKAEIHIKPTTIKLKSNEPKREWYPNNNAFEHAYAMWEGQPGWSPLKLREDV